MAKCCEGERQTARECEREEETGLEWHITSTEYAEAKNKNVDKKKRSKQAQEWMHDK